ncbi:MAG: hypothetical protein NT028_15240, partial [candidate division Zixibacteria bacterium]|nr:hypothetical protein [candidate division Zixibacteria bacterium]
MIGYRLILLVVALWAANAAGQDREASLRKINQIYLGSAVFVRTVPAGRLASGYLSILSSAPDYVAFISNRHVFADSKALQLTIPLHDTLTGMIA